MNNEEILKEILEVQKKQTTLLEAILEKTNESNNEYRKYLEEQSEANEEYRKSLEESAEVSARQDQARLKEHEAYLETAVTNRMTNYFRIAASTVLVGLIGYIVIFGIKVQ